MGDRPSTYQPPLVGYVVTAEELDRIERTLGDVGIAAPDATASALQLVGEIRRRPKFHRVGF